MSLLAYGDNLISLSLLAKLKCKKDVTLLGTGLTREVVEFIPDLDIPIVTLFERIPAFYDVNTRGIISAVSDWRALLKKLPAEAEQGGVFLLEKTDFRSVLLAKSISPKVLGPEKGQNVYEDRRNLIHAVLGEQVPLDEAARLRSLPQRVTINPASRVSAKAVAANTLGYLISYLKKHDVQVQLIDPNHEHAKLKDAVDSYHCNTSFHQAVELVRECDLYIGADSLFVHFAYHFGIPFLVLFNYKNIYFAPPGVEKQGNFLESSSTLSEKRFYQFLDSFFSF